MLLRDLAVLILGAISVAALAVVIFFTFLAPPPPVKVPAAAPEWEVIR